MSRFAAAASFEQMPAIEQRKVAFAARGGSEIANDAVLAAGDVRTHGNGAVPLWYTSEVW